MPGLTWDTKVLRRMPTALDVAYSVLGNRQAGWEIAQRMTAARQPGNFRDGYPYAHNLTALAATFDQYTTEAWTDTIYSRWLWALRALSAPTTDSRFPQAMRTRAWAMRTLNTQLASYTELKHDTILYGKQPYAASFVCEYPAGFVEPVPEFWQRMQALAESTAAVLERFPTAGTVVIALKEPRIDLIFGWTTNVTVNAAERHQARLTFCRDFAARMAALRAMAEKELRQEPFSQGEIDFIRGLMNRRDRAYEGPTFDGWYPGLFYKDYALVGGTADENGSNKWDALVADVFTAPPDDIDPVGGVLHEATRDIDLLMIAVDCGADRMVYAGPVLSHYEFVVPGPDLQRLSDSEWQAQTQSLPPRPDWTRAYLVPKQ